MPGRGGPRTAQRSELSFHCYSKHLLMRTVCVSGLGNQAGEQSWFKDGLEGAPAVLSSHLCPAATAGSRSQVLWAEGWFWLETNPRPRLLLPNHFLQRVLFTHPKFQQSAGYCSAWEALKMWLRTGTCISFSFSAGKAGGQAVRSCNKPRDLCYVHQDVAKGKKMVLGAEISDPCT